MKKKTWLIIISIFLFILIITNPTVNRYKEYLNSNGGKTENYNYESYDLSTNSAILTHTNITCGKEYNFFIFSVFKYQTGYEGKFIKHIGIFGNFIEIKQ